MDLDRLRAAYEQAKSELLAERTEDGHWIGELSSSALSTATAVSALAVVKASGGRGTDGAAVGPPESALILDLGPWTLDSLIHRGVDYLAGQQNFDGGFGDTDLSHSNIATTYLVVAALHLAGVANRHPELLARANAYIESKGRLQGLRERYGIDKTFVVPIMTNLALAGLVDWREIDPLPFELACVPQSLYRFVGMPVVSYAIPALVAIGQARYFHAPPINPVRRLLRWLSITRSLRVLRRMQPDSGGYLEATPLTSFVVMSLASLAKPRPVVGVNGGSAPGSESGGGSTAQQVAPRPLVGALDPNATEVIQCGVKFLANSMRPDGSWPIDTNLATWNTTLAINALAGAGEDIPSLFAIDDSRIGQAIDVLMARSAAEGKQTGRGNVLPWLVSCQHLEPHPFTGASPGGFGWSELSGAVPDADDTAGAILSFGALVEFDILVRGKRRDLTLNSLAFYAVGWLVSLQNRDGGWPTFCRGWGRLPFDRSGTDLTAHALRAIAITARRFHDAGDNRPTSSLKKLFTRVAPRALAFITRHQHQDGSWSPLWFGNQDHSQEDNPVYGTAKVLFAYRDLALMDSSEAQRGVAWLVANQNEDGGWGSGVWGKGRRTKDEGRSGSAELGGKAGVESARGVTGPGGTSHSVPGTEYSVLSTQYSKPGTTGNMMANVNFGSPQGADAPRSPIDASRSPATPHSALRTPQLISSVEETALAVEALLAALNPEPRTLNPDSVAAALEKGLTWLVERVQSGEHRQPAPIGFYFAKLWYYERLYPLTFTVAALGRACRQNSGRKIDRPPIAHPASTGTTPWTTAAP